MVAVRVLIVDDDAMVARSTARLAEQLGVEPVVVTDLANATRRMREQPPDGVLLDEHFPDGSGTAWLRERRLEGYAGPVLLCTGFDDVAVTSRAYLLRAEYLRKPFGSIHLKVFLRRIAAQNGLPQPFIATRVEAFSAAHQLSHRQTEVLALLVRGFTFARAAPELGLSTFTVKAHADEIRRASGLRSVRELVRTVREAPTPGFTCEWIDDA